MSRRFPPPNARRTRRGTLSHLLRSVKNRPPQKKERESERCSSCLGRRAKMSLRHNIQTFFTGRLPFLNDRLLRGFFARAKGGSFCYCLSARWLESRRRRRTPARGRRPISPLGPRYPRRERKKLQQGEGESERGRRLEQSRKNIFSFAFQNSQTFSIRAPLHSMLSSQPPRILKTEEKASSPQGELCLFASSPATEEIFSPWQGLDE